MRKRTLALIPILLYLLISLPLAGCAALLPLQPESGVGVTLVADGDTQALVVRADLTVSDVLRQSGVTLGSLDRVNPPGYSRVADGMTITVVRVREETVAVEEGVPFQSRTVPNEGLEPGETLLLQAGVNGTAEVTYRVTYENEVETSRSEIRRVTLVAPQDEVLMVGTQSDLPTVTVNGTLAYISTGNAWIVRQNSANSRPLTLDGGLDGRVFELSGDGAMLLYTRAVGEADAGADLPAGERPFNRLWATLDTTAAEVEPVDLGLPNVLWAAWVPGQPRTLVYSTAEPRASFPGWQAANDLWRAEISPEGELVDPTLLLEPSSGGVYGWYGTTFALSPDGVRVAWAQPDAVGVLTPLYDDADAETATPTPEEGEEAAIRPPDGYERRTLVSFAPWNAYDFVWVPTPAWTPEGGMLATVTHGAPLGSEAAEDSPVFSLVALPDDGSYSVPVDAQAGMWADPVYSPGVGPGGEPLEVRLSYLQAVEPLDSVAGRYRLMVMDRDGSNARAVYPAADAPGLLPQTYAWSPDGRQVALVDPGPEGNLLLVDIVTGLAQQVTSDGQSSTPRWVP
jgi:hypothetical protein